jgi:hypothetical protein
MRRFWHKNFSTVFFDFIKNYLKIVAAHTSYKAVSA